VTGSTDEPEEEDGVDSALRHYWYPVARSADVTDKPVGTMLLDEPLVLWRSASGLAAFRDLCVHRGTRLSIGSVVNGELRCAYHGWTYCGDGAVSRIPAIPGERGIPSRARAIAYPTSERYGLVFVCLGTPRRPIYEVPEFEETGFQTHILGGVPWRTGAARSLENFIDEAHLPWVHPGMLGSATNPPVIPSRSVQVKDGEFYFEYTSECRERLDPGRMTLNRLTYHVVLPFTLYHENISPNGERIIDLFMTTPVSERETIRYMVVARNFALDQPADKFIAFTSSVWEQDRIVVETQRPEELPVDLSEELHLRGPDDPSVVYRRMLRELGVSNVA
jgi:phenylpropionate dioxygenase-like ring-hydroxylating dioxygenase large terminal subunit